MPILEFQIPNKVVMEKSDEFAGKFVFQPLEPGFAITIGNAIRRVLLSSLEGYAITSIKIPEVKHELSTIRGVVEDVTEIVLNLKGVRFKKVLDSNDKIFVSLKNQDVFKAGDIGKFTHAYEILNPDHVIAHIEGKRNFEIELTVEKGRGYVPAEENKKSEQEIGVVPIDSIFTPIKNMKYEVENTRVKQRTDYEKLIIEMTTDGSVHPKEALKEAAHILIRHCMLFSDDSMQWRTQMETARQDSDDSYYTIRKLLNTRIADLDLSVRAFNCLKAAEIKTLGDLVGYDVNDLLKFRNFGKRSLEEIEELVRTKGLSFGMDTAKYKLAEE